MGAKPFLGPAQQIGRLEPQVQSDMGAFKQGADRHAELLLASLIAALVQARPSLLGLDLVNPFLLPTVRTHRAVRPPDSLQVFAGGFRVVKVRGGKLAHGALHF